jgi:hypothetical protein
VNVRRRYRRNEGFALTPYEPAPAPRADAAIGIAGLDVLGFVVNPKTKQPLIVCTDGEYVSIRSLDDGTLFVKEGVGYPSNEHEAAADATGYPRVHTPQGVTSKGGGYGTALYTGLCLGAWQVYWDRAKIGMSKTGQGISSAESDRSREASRWWDAAHDRGLTGRKEEEGESETEEHVNVDVDADDLNRIVSLDEGEITYVNEVDVDVTKPGEDLVFDYYKFKSAQKHNLVLLACSVTIPDLPVDEQLSYLWRQEMDNPETTYEVDDDVLLALDVRGLDPHFINLLALAYAGVELGEKAIDDMRHRHEHDLDPGSESPQGRLFKNAGNAAGMGEVLRARRRVGWADLEDLP